MIIEKIKYYLLKRKTKELKSVFEEDSTEFYTDMKCVSSIANIINLILLFNNDKLNNNDKDYKVNYKNSDITLHCSDREHKEIKEYIKANIDKPDSVLYHSLIQIKVYEECELKDSKLIDPNLLYANIRINEVDKHEYVLSGSYVDWYNLLEEQYSNHSYIITLKQQFNEVIEKSLNNAMSISIKELHSLILKTKTFLAIIDKIYSTDVSFISFIIKNDEFVNYISCRFHNLNVTEIYENTYLVSTDYNTLVYLCNMIITNKELFSENDTLNFANNLKSSIPTEYITSQNNLNEKNNDSYYEGIDEIL